ncbi:hypothetical protein [Streptomyces sp. NEAU-YJ-81]|nr:hypothetical protein [Streptomyces sp. NEAU-YJ-81]
MARPLALDTAGHRRDTPRHAFAPDRLWHWDGHTYQPLDRGTDPD